MVFPPWKPSVGVRRGLAGGEQHENPGMPVPRLFALFRPGPWGPSIRLWCPGGVEGQQKSWYSEEPVWSPSHRLIAQAQRV